MNEPPADELDLMRRAARGDRQALGLVVRTLLAPVQALCRALLRNGPDASDASQASMLEILRAAPSFRGDCPLRHWAGRITVRTSLRWMARERRLRAHAHDESFERISPEGGPAHVLLAQCLSMLPATQRGALLLRCSYGYSIKEIAELTAVSENTVKDRLLRARVALRQLTEQDALSTFQSSGHGGASGDSL